MIILIGFLVGAVLGSFSKALADRSLKNKSFLGRSHCEKCQRTLSVFELIPILSFLLQGGKCRYCKKSIGLEYLAVEVVMGVVVAYLFYQQISASAGGASHFQFLNSLFELVFNIFFVTILAVLFLTDLKEMFIPDRVVIPSIIVAIILLVAGTLYKIGYLYKFLLNDQIGQYLLPPHNDYFTRHAFMIAQPFLGALAVGIGIAAFFAFLVFITKSRGMGGGDIKLGMFMGLGLGFPGGVIAVILAFMSGAIVALMAVAVGKKGFKSQIPFGPFLILGSLAVLFWGREILNWYLNFGT